MESKEILTGNNVSATLREYLSPTVDIVEVVVEHGFAQSDISPLEEDDPEWW